MHWLFPHLALGYWSSLLLHSLCVTVDKFTKSLKCKCNVSVSEGFVVLCRSKPSMLSPSKQRPCWPQVSSSAVVFTAMRVNQINFFISIVLAISYSVFAGGYISGMPSQIYMVHTQILTDVSECVSLHVYVQVCVSCLCTVCAGCYSRFTVDDES